MSKKTLEKKVLKVLQIKKTPLSLRPVRGNERNIRNEIR